VQISERVFTTSARRNSRSTSRTPAQAIIEWKNEDVKEGIRSGHEAAGSGGHDLMESSGAHWFAIWTRSRPRTGGREQLERKKIDAFCRRFPLEPLEGSQEEDRLAAVPATVSPLRPG